ncbi:PAS/PAC sensor signal transduction histidine kinase [Oscillochloris trichoides DG-6]|uniref:histidine kinase n=1 Tax=Oscillochloris trichoides DG-6 TaxID=765420 RepID=E1IAQ7_9CHLR|nr:ATP-binding protein [Oscillochloris trichoides]EFO81736.1 PAS/PAC sensor signal transduction histidine kinase [Oscillochloris trichoides DG-6]
MPSLLDIILALSLLLNLGGLIWYVRRPLGKSALHLAQPADSLDPAGQPLFFAAAAAVDAGVIVVDQQRHLRFVSPAAMQMLGVNEPSLHQGMITIMRDHQADTLVGEVLHDGEPREMSMRPISSGRTLRLYASPLQGGGALLIIRDVTQLSMLERSRRDLVANVSHELRTPLASLKLLVETVQSSPPPDVAHRMLEQMAQEIDSVTQLVDELHDLAQIESGRVSLKLAPLPIGPVIERALERMRPQADRKGLTLGAEVPNGAQAVLMDPNRVGQILLNLLHNAIKFTAEGGSVQIRVRLVGEDAGQAGPWLLVSVCDTGVGIPATDLPRIFERFYKVDRARTRHAGGTGLGLAIAKHLVEGHGGRLWAESVEGRGSTFAFTLPVA